MPRGSTDVTGQGALRLPPERADVVVVGAGILGLATAVELLSRRPDWDVIVLEKEPSIATHQTGRNSCVIHSGVYYTPGSFKADLCVAGHRRLLHFCDAEGIPYELCGKVIVALDEGERPRLEELHRRALANGIPDAHLIDRVVLRRLEPHAAGVAALHLPSTGIVDFRRVAAALARELGERGGALLLSTAVGGIVERRSEVIVETTGGEIATSFVVACAGLQSDRVAAMATPRRGAMTQIVPFRGDYLRLRPSARELCRSLIYPVPDPRFPFLGIHANRRPDGEVWLGPNAVLALARERYRRRDVDVRDASATLRSRAFWRLARRHWRTGAGELYRDVVRRAFVAAARRYLPELAASDVDAAPAGIRAQAVAPDGTLVDDFLFDETPRTLHVVNAPSPAATSSLAIASSVADRALQIFGGR